MLIKKKMAKKNVFFSTGIIISYTDTDADADHPQLLLPCIFSEKNFCVHTHKFSSNVDIALIIC